jgi:hypothetical protein
MNRPIFQSATLQLSLAMFCCLASYYGPAPQLVADESRPEVLSSKRLEQLGIRTISGKHLLLVTDLPPSPAIDNLPYIFDQAVSHWAAYFEIPKQQWANWKMTGFLMKDSELFQTSGLFPKRALPPFRSGFTRNDEFWMFNEDLDYYRRHLLLHEGVHGFMSTFFSTTSPPWHCEGMAELLATHRWENGRLSVAYFPQNKRDVPMLGRIRIVQDEVAGGRILPLEKILSYGANAHQENVPYGWCWAAAAFLDGHPRYRDRFRELNRTETGSGLNKALREAFADDWHQLCDEWLIFVTAIEHGHDLASSAIQYGEGKPLPPGGVKVSIAANRGWQSSGIRLEAGQTYNICATGRYELNREEGERIWWCEPGGITLQYVEGQPLGMLLGAVHPDGNLSSTRSGLLSPEPVGLEKRLTPRQSGTLYLKINDRSSGLSNNVGKLNIIISQLKTGTQAEASS